MPSGATDEIEEEVDCDEGDDDPSGDSAEHCVDGGAHLGLTWDSPILHIIFHDLTSMHVPNIYIN